VFNKLRQQAHFEASHRTARFVASLMLVEAPVGIARGLPDVQTPRSRTPGVVQQNYVDRMLSAPATSRAGQERTCGPQGCWHPIGTDHSRQVLHSGRLGPQWVESRHSLHRLEQQRLAGRRRSSLREKVHIARSLASFAPSCTGCDYPFAAPMFTCLARVPSSLRKASVDPTSRTSGDHWRQATFD
jgi:hypothetical protein